jgi:type IV pilus assembly protein PilY1
MEVIDMKMMKILFSILFLSLMLAANSFAHDTDLYVGSESIIKPNILIVYDSSGSMDSTVDTGNYFDPAGSYPASPDIIETAVYYKNSGQWFNAQGKPYLFKNSVIEVECYKARDTLTAKGQYIEGNTDIDCTKTKRTLATGKYLNFFLASDGLTGQAKKRDIAKHVITELLSTISDARVGIAVFHPVKLYDQPDREDTEGQETEGGKIHTDLMDIDQANNRQTLIDAVATLAADDSFPWTTLAETLYEVGLYFQGAASHFNSPTIYTTPIQYYCQRNYVIIMTDGLSTCDRNNILKTAIGDQDGDKREIDMANDPDYNSYGSDYLDDVAKYLYETDLLPAEAMPGIQNITTYTIGFDLDRSSDGSLAKDLLRRTANYGHGKFYTTSSTAGLADAFSTILGEIFAKTSSYVAPIVPVSKFERTTAGDKIYLALFKPSMTGMWKGNIKKYGVAQTVDLSTNTNVGDILDVSNKKAVDSQGKFYPSSKSFWSTVADGGEVELGGVGEKLLNRSNPRKIYTFLPGDPGDEADDFDTSTNLTNSWNAFTTTNSRLTTSKLGVSTTEEKNRVIDFVHGLDVYDDNYNTITNEKRTWILGSFVHSRPFIIHYPGRTVLYAGANDGMLHAFDDETGEELWGFIPPCLLNRLQELHTNTPGMFVDGSPKAYITYDSNGNVTKAILIFGLRRGGDYYYALDVTNPLVPKYLWRIYKDKGGGFKELAQTWSAPIVGKVPYGSQTSNPPGHKWVVIFGAGYDEGQDNVNPPPDDEGRGVYMADVLTGSLVWWHSHPGGDSNMTFSIPSDVTKLDIDGDGMIDRLYVGDMNARMWRFDIGDLNKNGSSDPNEWTGRIIFKSNGGANEKRKIFYPPDVTLEYGYEMLFFGTGDREDPKSLKVPPDINRIYGLKDKNSMSILREADLEDVTEDILQSGTSAAITVQNQLDVKPGWYIIVTKQEGESCLSSPVVFYRTVYFTTFAPSVQHLEDPCFVGEGVAWLYAVDYMNGNAVFNFDLVNDVEGTVLDKSDRILKIGTAIPSGVIITVVGNTAVGYAGVGGGIFKPQMKKTKIFYPLHWKIVF